MPTVYLAGVAYTYPDPNDTSPGEQPSIYMPNMWVADVIASTNLTPVGNTMYAAPLRISRALTATRLGFNINTGFASTQVIRLGIYLADPVTLMPGSLLVDAGTIVPAANGVTSIVLSTPQVLVPGLYYLVLVSQGTTHPSIISVSLTSVRIPRANITSLSEPVGFTQAGVSAGLPSPFGATTINLTSSPICAIQVQ
jgi:hypothetical protein